MVSSLHFYRKNKLQEGTNLRFHGFDGFLNFL
jgi:hypothetical protein